MEENIAEKIDRFPPRPQLLRPVSGLSLASGWIGREDRRNTDAVDIVIRNG